MSFRPTSPTRPISPDNPRSKHSSRLGMWQKLQHFFGRDASMTVGDSDDESGWSKPDRTQPCSSQLQPSTRPVGVGLPRQATFKRQNSEKRERLCPVETLPYERRAYSSSRPAKAPVTNIRSVSVPPSSPPKNYCAAVAGTNNNTNSSSQQSFGWPPLEDPPPADSEHPMEYDRTRPPRPSSLLSSEDSDDEEHDFFEDRNQLNRELDTKWILNLSMHFRDKSDREKFFVTYAETPTRWRRVTVSCDYRNAEPKSLEIDLKEQQHQRDKSMQIYEAIRESLREIKFYDTVTNLKLETTDGRLHVHVTEDVNEIIPYPPITSLQHILRDADYQPRLIRESKLSFDSHLSGFVYKVTYEGRSYIKKEIPGPDTVDEFLYEVNALHALQDSRYVIDLCAIITDESGQIVKGLLIDHAERGAVVDLLYDFKGELSWDLRESWARHAIQGLSDIHEEGYVQGDFTLSNIVVNHENNARIIDINRRGCPVGWEPPEIAKKIASNQRISMYIGQKSDLYQLGMSLWALAMDDDEPERHDPPLSTHIFPSDVPQWYQEIVRICLSTRPRDRLSATELIKLFPPENAASSWTTRARRPSVRIRTEKQYINPAAAVEREDLERLGYSRQDQEEAAMYSPESSREDPTFTYPQSSGYEREYDNSSSEIERPRGRRRISDHDLMLQAQREYQAAQGANHDGDNTHDESAPVITISSSGMESHIIDADTQLEHPGLDEQHDRALHRPDLVSALDSPDLPYLSDRRLFPSHSETSENTPRNSSLQLFSNEAYEYRQSPVIAPIEGVSTDFAGMGSHHSPSEGNYRRMNYEDEATTNRSSSPSPPSLSFVDSGYNEPSAFGIEFGEDSDCKDEDRHNSRSDEASWKARRSCVNNGHSISHGDDEKKADSQITQDCSAFKYEELDLRTAPAPGTTGPNAIIEVLTDSEPQNCADSTHIATGSEPVVPGKAELGPPPSTLFQDEVDNSRDNNSGKETSEVKGSALDKVDDIEPKDESSLDTASTMAKVDGTAQQEIGVVQSTIQSDANLSESRMERSTTDAQ